MVLSAFFMEMSGSLYNCPAAFFSCRVRMAEYLCLLLDLFLVASAFRRSRTWGLVLTWFCSWNLSMFWYKISISVCFCTWLNPLKRWQVGTKLRKSFCGCVSSWSERFRNLSSLFVNRMEPLKKLLNFLCILSSFW